MRKRPGTGVSAFGFCSVRARDVIFSEVRARDLPPSIKGNLFNTDKLLNYQLSRLTGRNNQFYLLVY